MISIKAIGIVGAGTMGAGIASSCAVSEYKTLIYDINSGIVKKAIDKIRAGFDKLTEKNKIDKQKRDSAVANIIAVSGIDELKACDFIIEAAIEDIDKKKDLFQELESVVADDVIIATNTSSLSITSISSALKVSRHRVVGMHFFNPANIMKLVEVVKGEFTSDKVVNIVVELSKTLGKVPVVCRDTPAFIVNRVARAFYGESLKILGEESLYVETIDKLMKEEGGFAMGPFELMDLIGIDVNLSVTKSVYEAFYYDQKYKPSPIQQKMVDAGLLGRKTGQGFYQY
jgi:3-hydroxybutyryl-CoA dehydrogenase